MRLARLVTSLGSRFAMDDGERWRFVRSPFDPLADYASGGVEYADAQFLAPTEPRVVLGMAHNGSEQDRRIEPQAFHKSARTVADPGAAVEVHGAGRTLMAEAELAIVIGRDAHNLRPDNALDAVLGYVPANDVTAVDQIPFDSFWTQAKNGRNFTPVGPWIETEFDPSNAPLRLRVNGALASESSTAKLARGIVDILIYVTRHVVLGPGDLILTGCPGSNHPVGPGDEVTVEIGGLGALTNRIVR
ncbi:MAG TPA: fumarylacetoacetate hydrolase family protein [Galbitalea sp.]|jgi:2-keto-4-pentenoate hydratase/2-oxohepta-3-ene-1,7-dioic acid hydratase in catechol pathway|nr:fumarylacetoacetate hydrolase family protein [Galbitalea sp.]